MTWNAKERNCWDVTRIPILSVYDPTSKRNLFVATHSAFPLKLRSVAQNPGEGRTVAESELVALFYSDPNPDGATLYAVVGAPGTGKSQLIRLINLSRDQARLNQHIVYIPKGKTFLRGALEMILVGLEGAEYDDLRAELKNAVQPITDQIQAADAFLTELARVLRYPTLGGGEPENAGQRDLLPKLAEVVSDSHFTKVSLDLGIPQRITDLARGVQHDGIDPERDHQFTPNDIETLFHSGKLDHENLSKEARVAWRNAASRPMQSVVLQLLNHYVPAALNNAFLSSGTSLVEIMNHLRTLLHNEGKELVILIEDMADLSLVQMTLFQALITTVPEDQPTAPIRTIFAITPGKFEPQIGSLRGRIKLVVEVQPPDDDDSPNASVSFFSKYLNAARLPQNELETIDIDQPIPNACLSCGVRSECHSAFGEIDGVGLFPFTRRSFGLLRHALTKDSQVPRHIVGSLFRDFLPTATDDLAAGQFPSERLLAGFTVPSDRNPSNDVQASLKRAYPNDHERLVRLQQYWADDPDSPPDWPVFLKSVFQLPESVGQDRLGGVGRDADRETSPPAKLSPIPNQDHDSHEKAFREWSTAPGGLPETPARDARRSIFTAVCAALEESYGLRTGTTLINDRSAGNEGAFLRPDSFVLKKSRGGSEGHHHFASFEIDFSPESRSVIQFLVTGDYRNPVKLGEASGWVDELAARVYDEYVQRYGAIEPQLATALVSSRVVGSLASAPSGLRSIFGEATDLDRLLVGRSEKWRRAIEDLMANRDKALVRLDALIGTGKKGGGTLSTRFRAQSISPSTEKLVLDEVSVLRDIAAVEALADNQRRLSIRELLGQVSLAETIGLIQHQIDLLERRTQGQITPVAVLSSLRRDLNGLSEFAAVDLSEIDSDANLETLLQVLGAISPSSLSNLQSQLESVIGQLDAISRDANRHAESNGYPRDLQSLVEQFFADRGFSRKS
jgi:hypothetical protein